MQDLEARYRADPDTVEPGWRCILDVLRDLEVDVGGAPAAAVQESIATVYRQRGHWVADLDPLGLARNPGKSVLAASAAAFGAPGGNAALIERLESTYCGSLAVESAHIDEPSVREWIRAAMEDAPAIAADPRTERDLLERLVTAEEFERFMAVKFPAKKRFGAEGAESLIPLLDRIVRNAAFAGVSDIVIGTMHRGRLNASANVFGKPLDRLFAEFKGLHPFGAHSTAAADVPYHLGHEAELSFDHHRVRVTVSPNPSHLEAVNPVVLGRVRARQQSSDDPRHVLGVIIHTDASVVGQGLIAEMLQLSRLDGFSTAGTLHVIINNQIGFTTESHEARTSTHCSGPWKAIDSFIVHVNGDDPAAAVRAADLAFNFRQTQARDAVIDLVCYRRNGHNEVDEPRFTQPLQYRVIDHHPSVAARLGARLMQEGIVTAEQIASFTAAARARLDHAYDGAENILSAALAPDDAATREAARERACVDRAEPETGLPAQQVTEFLTAVSSVPVDMNVGPKIGRIVAQRAQTAATGVHWAVGEAMAFGSLVAQGVAVRLSGQDAVRGAFSQRHLALIDTETARRHVGIGDLSRGEGRFEAINSSLSEYAVLGFEYGYSVERPNSLVIWEAQFGDFANGAQIIIDQFLASGEEKWRQSSGLVMLLPNGLEGQGPEHSSGRIERFLQLCAQNNLQVAQPTTPANYFHLLRRQVHLRPRKPLVVMTPKSLLRHPAAVSTLKEFGPDTRFQPVMPVLFGAEVRQILVCSGKIFYDLAREREARNIENVAIIRLEQLYPFPEEHLTGLFERWPEAGVTWVQEEPRNLGAWNFVDRRLEAALVKAGMARIRVACVSRPESASPAGSFHGNHDQEQRRVVEQAFSWATQPVETVCTT